MKRLHAWRRRRALDKVEDQMVAWTKRHGVSAKALFEVCRIFVP